MAKVKPLTDTQVKAAKPQDKVSYLPDGDGLRLKVRPTGSKSWIFKFSDPTTRKPIDMVLGSYPEVSLSKARSIRQQYRELVADGISPKEHKASNAKERQFKASNTLIAVFEKWIVIKKSQVTDHYAIDVERSLRNHVFPKLGSSPIDKINAIEAIEALQPLKASGNYETIKRLCQRLNEMMNYAVNTGLIHANPLTAINAAFQKPVKKNMATISPYELPEFMKTLKYASVKMVTRCLIEWQLHTMVRPAEASGAKWEEVNLDDKTWTIPASRMKKKRPHVVPLSKQSLELLERIKPISGHREFIFPADRNPRTHTNEQTANAAIKRMGYKNKLVAHGMRSIASTALNENGFDPDVIESALAHVDKNEVRRAYNRSEYLSRRRELMTWWSNFIEEAETGKSINDTTNVIPLRGNG